MAQACEEGGHPELTAGLLRSGATLAQARAAVASAQDITRTAAALGPIGSAMAKAAIKGGVSAEVFREMAFAAKADAEPRTDTARPAQTAAVTAIDSRSIYARANAARQH